MAKALSIRAPWWWWILYAGKDIENRDWPTKYRGIVLIHASKWWSRDGFEDDWHSADSMFRATGKPFPGTWEWSPDRIRSVGGHIVGRAEIVDCVQQSSSPWFVGRYGFVLRNAEPIAKPYPVRGALGFFDPPTPESP